MTTVDYFCYAVRQEWIFAEAAAAGWEVNGDTARHFPRNLIFQAGLGRKATLHYVWNDAGRFTCIVLAASSYNQYAPYMPIGREPPPEEYEALRVLLRTDKPPQWRRFRI